MSLFGKRHSKLKGIDAHTVVWKEVSNTAARLALVVTNDNEGFVVKQLDNGSYWILSDYSVPTWKELTSVGVAAVTSVAGRDGDVVLVEADITDLGSYPDSTGQLATKVPQTDGSGGWTFIPTPAGGGPGVTDHGDLTGRSDDDHTHYHTDARGDARYFTQAQVTASLAGKSDTGHTHTLANITNAGTAAAANTGVASGNVPVLGTSGTLTLNDGTNTSGYTGSGINPNGSQNFNVGGTVAATPHTSSFTAGTSNAASTKGGTMYVRGGRALGATSPGGDLNLYGGLGTSVNGDVVVGGYNDAGTDFAQAREVRFLKGVAIVESADHPNAPASGKGQVWVRTSDNALMYTSPSDAPSNPGTDYDLTAAGTANIAIEDEGTQVVAAVARMNFTGSAVAVTDAGGGEVTVSITGGGIGGQTDTVTGTGIVENIGTNVNANIAIAQQAQATLLGRALTAGTGRPVVVTATEVRAVLNVADGATAAGATGDAHAAITTGNPHNLDAADVGAAPSVHTHDTLANVATSTILGRVTGGSGLSEELTPTQVRTLINVADGANLYVHPNHSGDVVSTADGATVIQVGAVDIPMLSATGTPSGTTYLRGDNQWATPAGGGGNLNDLGDVTLTTPATDAVLIKSAGDWIDGTINTNSITNAAVTVPKLSGWTHAQLEQLTPDAGKIFCSSLAGDGQILSLPLVAGAAGQMALVESAGGVKQRVNVADLVGGGGLSPVNPDTLLGNNTAGVAVPVAIDSADVAAMLDHDLLVNAGASKHRIIDIGTDTPTATTANRFYYETDANIFSFDNGSTIANIALPVDDVTLAASATTIGMKGFAAAADLTSPRKNAGVIEWVVGGGGGIGGPGASAVGEVAVYTDADGDPIGRSVIKIGSASPTTGTRTLGANAALVGGNVTDASTISATQDGGVAIGNATTGGLVSSSGTGAVALGSAIGAGSEVKATATGAQAGGNASTATNTGKVIAAGQSSRAMGQATGSATGVSLIETTIFGAGGDVHGRAQNGGIIRVAGQGGKAWGDANGLAASIIAGGSGYEGNTAFGAVAIASGLITATGGDGALAGGKVSGVATNITASGDGSIAFGNALSNAIAASAAASFALGDSTSGAIAASQPNTLQLGPGTNNVALSLQVGNTTNGVRLQGGGTTSTVAGSIWSDGTDTFIRSGGANRNMSRSNFHSKSITVETPTASENLSIFFTTAAITVSKIVSVITGTTSVTFDIEHGTSRATPTGTGVIGTDVVCNSSTAGVVTTSFADATIPANSFVWLSTSGLSGTPTSFNVTIEYTED